MSGTCSRACIKCFAAQNLASRCAPLCHRQFLRYAMGRCPCAGRLSFIVWFVLLTHCVNLCEISMSTNSITTQYLNSQTQPSFETGASNNAGFTEEILQDIEKLLADSNSASTPTNQPNTGQFPQQGGASTTGQSPSPYTPVNFTGQPSTTGTGAPNGQGLHDVKINSKAGGEALHLQEDSNGNLYNKSGDSVGVIDSQGNVTLNSGATKEIERLQDGGNPLAMLSGHAVKGQTGDGGNVTFSSSDVTVSAGDLNQQNDF